MTTTEETGATAAQAMAQTAVDALNEARTMTDEACAQLIRADLAGQAGPAQEALEAATAAREQAEAAVAPVQAVITRLEALNADVQQRIAGLDAAIAGGDEDPTAEIEAISLYPGMVGALANRQARIDMHRTLLTPLHQAVSETTAEESRARGQVEDLIIAAADPLDGHPAARGTAGYELWIRYRALEILAAGDARSPHWAPAKAHLFSVLKSSKLGAAVETAAIEAFRSGVPEAVAAGGASKTWPDGTHVTVTPGQPPVVSHGRASSAQLAEAPAAQQADTRSGAEVMAAAWGNVAHETSSGLYVHP